MSFAENMGYSVGGSRVLEMNAMSESSQTPHLLFQRSAWLQYNMIPLIMCGLVFGSSYGGIKGVVFGLVGAVLAQAGFVILADVLLRQFGALGDHSLGGQASVYLNLFGFCGLFGVAASTFVSSGPVGALIGAWLGGGVAAFGMWLVNSTPVGGGRTTVLVVVSLGIGGGAAFIYGWIDTEVKNNEANRRLERAYQFQKSMQDAIQKSREELRNFPAKTAVLLKARQFKQAISHMQYIELIFMHKRLAALRAKEPMEPWNAQWAQIKYWVACAHWRHFLLLRESSTSSARKGAGLEQDKALKALQHAVRLGHSNATLSGPPCQISKPLSSSPLARP